MNKGIFQVTTGLLMSCMTTSIYAGEMGSQTLTRSGVYLGAGGGWTLTDEEFSSTVRTSTGNGALDDYDASQNRLSPLVQLGYWSPMQEKWLWGVVAQWEYSGYKTRNVHTSHGQYLPNASFSSINIFGPDVIRDFTSQTRVENEVRFLVYLGEQFQQSHVYLGIGPAVLNTKNTVFVSSVHTAPNNGSDTLISGATRSSKTMWGGSAQVGYNYFINPYYFVNLSYTYTQTARYNFDNLTNAALLNGAANPGPTALNLNRRINIAEQGIMLSINRVI